MKWVDRIPLLWLVPIALWLAVAPVVPEPHLVEKLRMLSQGSLQKPLDIFDLLLHSLPLCLLTIRVVRIWLHRKHRGAQR